MKTGSLDVLRLLRRDSTCHRLWGLARSIRTKPVYSPRIAYTSTSVAVIGDRGCRSHPPSLKLRRASASGYRSLLFRRTAPARFVYRVRDRCRPAPAQSRGSHSRKSSSDRTRARKPERISWRHHSGQSGAGVCTRGRAGPGDHAHRASPFHARRGQLPGYSV